MLLYCKPLKQSTMSVSIPAFHVSDISKVSGSGDVFIASRQDAVSSGNFTIKLSVTFNPAVNDYPTGTVFIKTDMSDGAKTSFEATSIELVNSYGKHNPTVYITGRCKAGLALNQKGLRFWLMIANNKLANANGTPDVVGFVIHDNLGSRIAYGTGPLKSGDITIDPK
jgi:hypothetical protein